MNLMKTGWFVVKTSGCSWGYGMVIELHADGQLALVAWKNGMTQWEYLDRIRAV